MKPSDLLLNAAVLLIIGAPCLVKARDEAPKSSEDLIAQVVKATDRKSFNPASRELVRRVELGGAEGEAVARSLLTHREEITPEPGVKAMLDELVGREEAPLAARLLLQIAKAKSTVGAYKKGHVAVGRVVVPGGKLDPELVLAQMEILPGGYFAGEVGDLQRPIGFRAEGYTSLDVPLKGKEGDVVCLGTVTLQPTPADRVASLKGRVMLDDIKGADTTTVQLSLSVPPPNTPHNGYSPRRRWPEAISVPVSKAGEFKAVGLSPGDYTMIVEAKGHVRSIKRITPSPGQEQDAGTINLKTTDIGFYIGKSAPRTGELPWEKDYPSALKKAQAEKKPLMVMMTATWCGPCKMLEKETLDDPWVRYFLSSFVIVKAYEDKDVEKTYGLNGYPTLVFTDSDGKEACRTFGHQPTIPFAGVCVKALKALGLTLPPELQQMVEKKVITPAR